MMKIMSKRDKMVGMKSMLSSPLESSQRPNTELAAARTEQREFRVVVMPAWEESGVKTCEFSDELTELQTFTKTLISQPLKKKET